MEEAIRELVAQLRIANRLKVAEIDLRSQVGEEEFFKIRYYLPASDWALLDFPDGDEVYQ